MDEDLWSLLTASPDVQAECSERIFWGEAPQGAALPAIVLHILGGADTPHLRGTDGLWKYSVQIDCYGLDRPSVRKVSRAVLTTLNGHHGPHLRGVFVTSTREDIEDGAVDRPSRISHDFNVFWRA